MVFYNAASSSALVEVARLMSFWAPRKKFSFNLFLKKIL